MNGVNREARPLKNKKLSKNHSTKHLSQQWDTNLRHVTAFQVTHAAAYNAKINNTEQREYPTATKMTLLKLWKIKLVQKFH